MTKRLFLDVETSLMAVGTFSLFPKYIDYNNILKDWHIICAAWKWEGEDIIYGLSTYNENDKKVVKELRKAICEADELVYHNGTKFDYKKINTRVLLNKLPPMTKPRETDTLTQCRRHFALTSNRLDYIGQALGVGRKIHTEPGLWVRALNYNKVAIDQMLEYNKGDVVLLEAIFNILRPHIDLGFNPNINTNANVCTHCGSDKIQYRGYCYTKTIKYRRYQCLSCYGWCQSKCGESTKDNGELK